MIFQKILIVEPNSSIAQAAKTLFAQDGHDVTVVGDLTHVEDILEQEVFTTVFMRNVFHDQLPNLPDLVHRSNPNAEIKIISSYGEPLLNQHMNYDQVQNFFIRTVDHIISLLEANREEFRNYPHNIARHAKLIAKKMCLPKKTIDSIYLAAYLHNFWKTLIRLGEAKPHPRDEYHLIVTYLESLELPAEIKPILMHINEFYDGSGFPGHLSGNQIPIGSRILAAAEAFEEMLKHGLVKSITDYRYAEIFRKASGRKFDPNVVEIFLGILKSKSLIEKADGEHSMQSILLADRDPTSSSLIEMRLINEGYRTRVARTGQEALDMISTDPPDLILCDVVLPGFDGFELCRKVKSEPKTKDLPFIFISSKKDDESMTLGLQIGAEDFLPKPVNLEFLLTKLKKIMIQKYGKEEAIHGVRGNLKQMALLDIVQILGVGQKTARVNIDADKNRHANLYLENGSIVCAETAKKIGEEAFYELMTWQNGTFSIQPNEITENKNISSPNDYLLLEAMRRLDEEQEARA